MLYKEILTRFGRSLHQEDATIDDDLVHNFTDKTLLRHFRSTAVKDLSAAKPYLLAHNAASYIASLKDDLFGWAPERLVERIAEVRAEVEWPTDLVWIEYDAANLMANERRRKGLPSDTRYTDGFGLEGLLCDRRNADETIFTLYRKSPYENRIDPTVSLSFPTHGSEKTVDLGFDTVLNDATIDFFESLGTQDEKIDQTVDLQTDDTIHAVIIAFLFFAALDSDDETVMTSQAPVLSPKEEKTARKFGKSWILDIPRSHLTVRIGNPAVDHMIEQAERLTNERRSITERTAPVQHTVRQHERRYKNGKIVLIREHKRGTPVDQTVPTRVMGPRQSS